MSDFEGRFNMKHILEADKLHMELDVNIFETDIKYSSNTVNKEDIRR